MRAMATGGPVVLAQCPQPCPPTPPPRRGPEGAAHADQAGGDSSGKSVMAAMAAALGKALGDEFTLVEAVPMYQIQVFVFVRVSHLHHASRVAVSQVPTFRAAYSKIGGQMTPTMLARRKGGVAVTLSLGRTTFCFVDRSPRRAPGARPAARAQPRLIRSYRICSATSATRARALTTSSSLATSTTDLAAPTAR